MIKLLKYVTKILFPMLFLALLMTAPATVSANNSTGNTSAVSKNTKNKIPVKHIKMKHTALSLTVDDTFICKVKIFPMNATNKKLTFHSTDSKIDKVDKFGKIKALTPGKTSIICSTSNGITSKCKLKVKKKTVQLTLKKYVQTLYIGDTSKIVPYLSGVSAADQVTYRSKNPMVAKVSSNGKITALKAGSTSITVTAADGSGLKASCSVRVLDAADAKDVKTFIIGASRTQTKRKVLRDKTNSISFIEQPGARILWFKNVAFPLLKKGLKKNPSSNVVICMGTNDLQNVQGYITLCSRLIKKCPAASIYIATVTPVDERYTYLTNSSIRSFNKRLQAAFGAQIINTYHYLNKIGYNTIDGIHYDGKTAGKELNYILDAL